MDTKDFDVVAMRTDLHQIPELGFNEHKTSDYVAAKLKEMGLEPIRGIGGTGVVAYIDGTEPGPTVMLRADMDALPFVIDGKDACIHACGHDSHTAMVLATAAKLIGHVKKGRVDYAFGAHVRPIQDIPDGTVCAAVRHTSSTFCIVELKGKVAHGSRPHLGASVVEAAVLATNAVNSLWVNPNKAWSAKVTSIDCASTATNIIPDKGKMILDIRAQDNETMTELLEKLKTAITNACACVNVTCEITFPGGVIPAAVYDEDLVDQVRKTIGEVLGEEKVAKDCGGGGEDFHYFKQKKPELHAAYIGVGTGVTPGLHDPRMTMNPESLRNGVKVLEKLILNVVG